MMNDHLEHLTLLSSKESTLLREGNICLLGIQIYLSPHWRLYLRHTHDHFYHGLP